MEALSSAYITRLPLPHPSPQKNGLPAFQGGCGGGDGPVPDPEEEKLNLLADITRGAVGRMMFPDISDELELSHPVNLSTTKQGWFRTMRERLFGYANPGVELPITPQADSPQLFAMKMRGEHDRVADAQCARRLAELPAALQEGLHVLYDENFLKTERPSVIWEVFKNDALTSGYADEFAPHIQRLEKQYPIRQADAS